jgi:hypothetical protein
VRAVVADVVGGEAPARHGLDAPELREHHGPVVDDPAPVAQGRQAAHPAHPAADLAFGLHEMHRLEAPAPERHSAFQPGGACPDDEDRSVGVGGDGEALGVPSAAVLLARRRVLDAAKVSEPVHLHDADVRARALADLVGPAVEDLLG